MTEAEYLKKFEERPDYWEGRYYSILYTLKTLDEAGISLIAETVSKMSVDERNEYLNSIAYKLTSYEWEQNAR